MLLSSLQWAEVSSHTLEETVDAVSQSAHVTVIELIGQTSQRLSRVDGLTGDDPLQVYSFGANDP